MAQGERSADADGRKAAAPRRKRRSSAEIINLIIDAAGHEFEQLGYSGATTAAIARRADVTETQIFRFFGSKQDLFRAAIFKPLNTHFSQFFADGDVPGAGAESDVRDAARAYIRDLQRFMEKNSRMLMSLIVAGAYGPGASDGVGEIEGLQAYFDQGAAMSSRRVGANPRVDPRLMVRVSFAAVLANVMFKDWLFPAGMASDDAIADAVAEFVIDGISANQDEGRERR